MRELLWYRVPVSRDSLNWSWPTLAAVMAGRAPVHRLEVVHERAKIRSISRSAMPAKTKRRSIAASR